MSPRRILVFQHIACEHPGAFRPLWKAANISWDAVELDEGDTIPDDLSPYDALVVMGGPMDVWERDDHPWLIPEIAAIRTWINDLKRPYLGICLGHQLLAEAMGGRVGPGASEVGFGQVDLTPEGRADPLLAQFGAGMDVFQWHSAEVVVPPENAAVLARNDACGIQAMRVGRNAWGLQYHVELTADTVPEWAAVPAYAASLEATFGTGAIPRLQAEVIDRLPAFEAACARLNDAFLAAIPRRAAA